MQIQDFFEEIQNYGHLIIDLRRTFGGAVMNFLTYVMGPNIEENLRIDGYAFFRGGAYAAR